MFNVAFTVWFDCPKQSPENGPHWSVQATMDVFILWLRKRKGNLYSVFTCEYNPLLQVHLPCVRKLLKKEISSISTIPQDKLLVSKDTCRPHAKYSIQALHPCLFCQVLHFVCQGFFFSSSFLILFLLGLETKQWEDDRFLKGHFFFKRKNCLCADF